MIPARKSIHLHIIYPSEWMSRLLHLFQAEHMGLTAKWMQACVVFEAEKKSSRAMDRLAMMLPGDNCEGQCPRIGNIWSGLAFSCRKTDIPAIALSIMCIANMGIQNISDLKWWMLLGKTVLRGYLTIPSGNLGGKLLQSMVSRDGELSVICLWYRSSYQPSALSADTFVTFSEYMHFFFFCPVRVLILLSWCHLESKTDHSNMHSWFLHVCDWLLNVLGNVEVVCSWWLIIEVYSRRRPMNFFAGMTYTANTCVWHEDQTDRLMPQRPQWQKILKLQ